MTDTYESTQPGWQGPLPDPTNNDHFWDGVMAVDIAVFAVFFLMRRVYMVQCKWCGKRHRTRPPNMTTSEFLRIYCGGWRAYNKMNEAGEITWKQLNSKDR